MLVAALFPAAASTGVVAGEFRAADTRNDNDPTVQALRYMGSLDMGSLIAERSAGRHQIKFHSRQFGEEKETIERTRAGAVDINRTNVALIGTMVPAMSVLAMEGSRRLIAQAGGGRGRQDRHRFRPYAVRGGDGGNLRQGAERPRDRAVIEHSRKVQ
jgi:hypothetical protein